MSGISKGLGKFGKILVPVLGIAAIVFTAGAALPAVGALIGAGGFGSAVAGGVASLGLTGTVASALTGAVTYAGYGAAAGALTSLVSGGKWAKGAQQGALIGAATGGVMGGLGLGGLGQAKLGADGNWATGAQGFPESSGIAPTASAGPATGQTTTLGARTGLFNQTPLATPTSGPGTDVANSTPLAPNTVISNPAATPTTASGGGIMGFLGTPGGGEMGGALLKGFGGAFTGQADADAALNLQRQQQKYVAGNYANPSGVGLFKPAQPTTGGRSPTQAFPQPQPALGYTYEYDPATRRLVKVPTGTQMG